MDDKSVSFENALKRLSEIVTVLENEEPDLEAAVNLYKEGKDLVVRCEGLLKKAQAQIDAVNAATGDSEEAVREGRRPVAPRPAPASYDDSSVDDEEIPF